MNSKKIQLILELRNNAREKLTSISKRTNIPISTLFDLLKELNEDVIKKSTIILDYSKLGFHTKALVFLKVNRENKEKLKHHLNINPCINSLHKVNHGWNFIIETVHRNIKELDDFLEKLEDNYNIEDKQIHYLIDEVKREGFIVG
mgnify:CR=1 FL=1